MLIAVLFHQLEVVPDGELGSSMILIGISSVVSYVVLALVSFVFS